MDSEELEKVEKNLEEELPDLNDIEMEKVKVGKISLTKIWSLEGDNQGTPSCFFLFGGGGEIYCYRWR